MENEVHSTPVLKHNALWEETTEYPLCFCVRLAWEFKCAYTSHSHYPLKCLKVLPTTLLECLIYLMAPDAAAAVPCCARACVNICHTHLCQPALHFVWLQVEFFWRVRGRACQSHKFFSMNTCWLYRHRCSLIIFNMNEFNYGAWCQRFAIVHARLTGTANWQRLNGTVVIPVSSVPCLRKSLLRSRVLVMKKQSMLAGQSAVFFSFGCDKSRRAFKGLACEVPMQDGDMFVFWPPFASFTWNARKKNADKMDSQWQKYLNRYLRHTRGWMLLFERIQSFLWAQSALCCSMLQICRTHHRPSREKYCFWSHQVGKNTTLNLERVQFCPTMMCHPREAGKVTLERVFKFSKWLDVWKILGSWLSSGKKREVKKKKCWQKGSQKRNL